MAQRVSERHRLGLTVGARYARMAVARCRHCSACSALPLDLYTSARLAWLTATAGWLFPYDFWYTRSPRSRLRSAWSRSPVACAAFPMFVKHRPAEAAITSCRKRQISVVFEMPLDDAVLIFDTRSRRCRMAAPITAAAMGMHARGGAGGGLNADRRRRDNETFQNWGSAVVVPSSGSSGPTAVVNTVSASLWYSSAVAASCLP